MNGRFEIRSVFILSILAEKQYLCTVSLVYVCL